MMEMTPEQISHMTPGQQEMIHHQQEYKIRQRATADAAQAKELEGKTLEQQRKIHERQEFQNDQRTDAEAAYAQQSIAIQQRQQQSNGDITNMNGSDSAWSDSSSSDFPSTDSADRLISELSTHKTNTLPLWSQMTRLNPPAPAPRCTPYVWRYSQIRPYLLRAGDLITEKQAERRVLMLINPARNEAPYTTDTIYGGLQLVMPNETAPAHRHVAFAMRFIVEGEGGFTAVNGSRVNMRRGDVILTPVWNWHDHGNGGDKPMIWLDGLDLPLFRHFPVHFVEHFAQPRYPADDVDSNSSPIVFPWHKMKAKLDANGTDKWSRERYLRADGSEVSLTLGATAELIPPHSSSKPTREVASSIYHVIEGTGHSTIGDSEISWTKGDTFCVPTWMDYTHFNDGEEAAYLYRCDDLPMMRALGFHRVEGQRGEDVYFR